MGVLRSKGFGGLFDSSVTGKDKGA